MLQINVKVLFFNQSKKLASELHCPFLYLEASWAFLMFSWLFWASFRRISAIASLGESRDRWWGESRDWWWGESKDRWWEDSRDWWWGESRDRLDESLEELRARQESVDWQWEATGTGLLLRDRSGEFNSFSKFGLDTVQKMMFIHFVTRKMITSKQKLSSSKKTKF